MKIFFLVFFFGLMASASTTRTIDADAVISSDHTKTYTFPTAAGALLGAGSAKQETPSGTVNGSNTSFTLSSTPLANAAVNLFMDGQILIQGTDYTISSTTITMTTAPALGQKLYATYLK